MGTGFAAREPEKNVIIAISQKGPAARFLRGQESGEMTRAGAGQSRHLPKCLKKQRLCTIVPCGIWRGASAGRKSGGELKY
jgi:hypothetical protein